ncbi:MAG TPA: phosphoglucosamine mutase [Acidimicrobiales bacterium]|nr:phosphoglucosamine mutase [Acidimicrobiales bacterium]
MTLRFGTDGIRGEAGADLTPELVLALGRAAAAVIGAPGVPFVVGRDTRWSGPMLHAALAAGLTASGFDVVDLGVVPTPAVAAAALALGAPAAVISASHNPYADNGIKLLSAGGRKLTDEQEDAVEAVLAGHQVGPTASGDHIGRLRTDPGLEGRYIGAVVAALAGRRLDGIRVVIDCANGAATHTAPAILDAAGADVVEVLADQPDGRNINAGCGSTDPSGVSAAVIRHRADAGLAFDGDADRVIAVDENGDVVDGDRLLALFAGDLAERGLADGGGVAVTVMTNLGFHRAMAAAGVPVTTTPVGDRHVLAAMEERSWPVGGEQSGHIIFRGLFADLAPTGDGVLTGLLLLDLVRRRQQRLSVLAGEAMVRLPQVLLNVRVADHSALGAAQAVWQEVAAVEGALGDQGRVLLRPSGTEPLVRVMVEAPTEADARRAADRLAGAVVAALGRPA